MAEPIKKTEEVFDVERIRKLIELMKEHDLAEIDLRQSAQRIRLCRGGQVAPAGAPLAQPMYAPAPVFSQPAPSAPSAPAAEIDGPHIVLIKSPMVGTFYSRANPNAKNFVEAGSDVAPDSVVCIIEAMKVFNEIPAEIRGKIVSVLVKNEETVDFGKPLFKVDTRG
ncbi:MAG: acetyl-CoA carboxylase biotin carboxyl carrier protein [Planctomycetota bacterium]|nr:acetyl-CoA carboxylase biotin carboxyl carrier protein [Planctomycetota bacterium]